MNALTETICSKFWLNHHHILSLARHADYGVVWLNSIFLMFQSFIPFPTALMGEYAGNRFGSKPLRCRHGIQHAPVYRLAVYILRNLIKPDLLSSQEPHIILKSFVGPPSYLLGAATSWFNVHGAFLLYLVTPLFFMVPPQGRRSTQSYR